MARPERYPTPAHAEADRLLGEMGAIAQEFRKLQSQADQEMSAVKEKYGTDLGRLKLKFLGLEQALLFLERSRQADFFGALESARVDLASGALLYELSRPVIRRKTVTPEKLEALGWPEAVKVVKSVDWDLLETWPEARLVEAGTERRVKEVFSYELTGAQAGKPAPPGGES